MILADLFAHADYARQHPGDETVLIALCDAIDEYYCRTPEWGKIYYLRAGEDGPIKIGFTKGNPSDRITVLQTGCPYPIIFLGAQHGTQVEERRLHREYAPYWLSGEWFKPHPTLLLDIMERLSPYSGDTIADFESFRREARRLSEQRSKEGGE